MNYEELKTLKHRDDLGEFLNQHGLVGTGVEVGSLDGWYARTIISRWRGELLTLVDPWETQPIADYKERQREEYETAYLKCLDLQVEFNPRIKILRKLSVAASEDFEDYTLDFVYIDANHSFEAVLDDMHYWWSKVKRGGILGGHDYCNDTTWPAFMEVKRAVDLFASTDDLFLHVTTEDANKSWWIAKP